MTVRERIQWAGTLLLLGCLLPSLLQLRIELRGWHQGVVSASHAVVGKWLLEFDGLQSISFVCLVPFGVLALCFLFCASRLPRRDAILFAFIGLVPIAAIWVPFGIHQLKATYSHNSPPFAVVSFWGLSLISTLLVLMTLGAFVPAHESDPRHPRFR